MRDDRPAVILALFDDVEFVAAARAMFVFPQAAGCGIKGQALFAAVTDGPDFRQRAGRTEEWIAGRGLALRRNVDDLAEIRVQLLRHVPRRGSGTVAVANDYKQIAVGRDGDAAAGLCASRQVRSVRQSRFGAEDHLHIGQRAPVKPRPRDVGIAYDLVGIAKEGEEDAVVGGELGIERESRRPVSLSVDRPVSPGSGSERAPRCVQDAHRAGQFFGDEDISVGKKSQGPGGVQGAGERGDLVGCGLVIGRARLVREKRFVVTLFGRSWDRSADLLP